MRVTVLAVGSRGDVQPYVALGVGLKQAGHEVRVATHRNFEQLVRDRGLGYAPMDGDPREVLETEPGRAWLESGSNPVRFLLRFLRLARPFAERFLDDSLAACEDAEAIVCSPLGSAGYHIAEARGLPSCLAALQPMSRTRAFPAQGIPSTWRLGGVFNLLSHVAAEQATWQPFRGLVNDWRRDVLGIDPLPFSGPYRMLSATRYPVLYGFSPIVLPRSADWPSWLRVTGYWFLDPTPDWSPPAALVDFLSSGPPPVYVGFGSMTDRDPEALTALVLEALSRTRQRAVLSRGWAGLTQAALPEWAHVVDDVPHHWLLPRTAAAVHHGGAGTTASGLRAGVPNVAVPFFADQHLWGERIAALRAGPAPIPRRELSAARLAAAIRRAVGDGGIRAAAAAVGRRIDEEDGVAEAVRAFDALATSPRAPRRTRAPTPP